jgi:molecular chaperone DnaK (HSP70)
LSMSAIAIDFGTSNTVVTRWNEATQQAEVLNFPQLSQTLGNNPSIIPSLLYVVAAQTGEVIAGQAVNDRGYNLKENTRFFRSFKRGIGANVQGFLPELDGVAITFEQVGQWFLESIIQALPPELINKDQTLEELILTVPVDSFEAYRYWLAQVCQALPVAQVRIIDEPTAAALGYGAKEQGLLLVVDFGGGTLDLSLIKLESSLQKQPLGFILKWGNQNLGENSPQQARIAKVLAKVGLNLGGTDIDNWLFDHFVQSHAAEARQIPHTPLTTRLMEKLKIQLSEGQEATEVYFNEQTFDSYEFQLDRSQFQEILKQQGFFEQLDNAMAQLLQQARRRGVEVTDIESVLLVGGTTQIPAVQDWIRQYFQPEQIRANQPLTAIAQGALQVGRGIKIQDFLYHSYGIRYWNRRQNCHSWHPLIHAGQPYPMTVPVPLVLGASVENQPSVELIIGELGAEDQGTEVYFEGDRLITKKMTGVAAVKPLNETAKTIAHLDPRGTPGSDRIKVEFQVDQQRSLRITVQDILTGATLLNDMPVVQLS